MNSFLVQFRNKNDIKEATENIQIDYSVDLNTLTSIVNSLRSTNSNYYFYYFNQRVTVSLAEIIDQHKLSSEEVILIEYIDENDFKADSVKECCDTVTNIVCNNNVIYYLTYSGDIIDYQTDNIISKKKNGIFNEFSYDNNNVYDLINDSKIIHTFNEKILCGSSYNENITVATEDKVYLNKDTVISQHTSFIRSLKMNENVICWIESYNKLNIYDLHKKELTVFTSEYSLVDIAICPDSFFITTSNNKILKYQSNTAQELDICFRLTKFILLVESTILYTAQNEIISCVNKDVNLLEMHFHKLNGQVNAITFDKNNIYVANDNFISTFHRSTFKI